MSEQLLACFEPGGPDSEAFMNNGTDLVRGIMGPIGSGKSVACCAEIMMRSCEQAPGRDGVRRSRWAIIRNTYPELKSTTIKTWLDWFPESVFGRMKWDAPITHQIAFNEPTLGRIEIEVLFLAMDRPDHVKKLLSLEVTGVWINEARSVPKAIVDAATGRVGRYPSKRDKPDEVPADQWPTWFGVIMDTNPPDDDHWWYRLAEEDQPAGWAFYRQPSGLSPDAENKSNLPRNYYENLQAGKTPLWVEVYVHGRYGSVMDGKPVYPEYNDAIHCAKEPLRPILGLPLVLGFDFGLTPAAIIGQLTPRGQIRLIEELIGTDIGIGNFCRQVVVPHLRMYYPQWRLDQRAGRDNNYIEAVGDPAGIARDGDERTSFQVVQQSGILIVPASTNNFTPRREAVANPLSRLLDGEPGMLISPTCKVTRKGFNGGYRYRRLQVAGDERYTEAPEKNQYSHIHDSIHYVCLKFALPQTQRSRPQAGYQPLDRTIGL